MKTENLKKFIEVIAQLRDPETGCPWDIKQTHESLKPYMIEESYELLDAIDSGNDEDLASELGDVLLQVVLHAQVAKDRNAFDIEDVAKKVSDKMIRRHPHVFANTKVSSVEDVKANWEKIKLAEGEAKEKHLFSGISDSLPALLQAQEIGKRAATQNFDWRNIKDVFAKVKEELCELEVELNSNSSEGAKSELGDLLFALSQLARHLDISAEDALRGTNKRFITRYRKMEELKDKSFDDMTDDELEALWQQAKATLNQ